MSFGQIIEDAARAYLTEQIKTVNIRNWNGANLAYVDKAHVANKLGLTPEQLRNVMPYPPSVNIVTGSDKQEAQPGLMSKIIPYALAAVIGAAGSGIGTYFMLPTQEQHHEQREPDPGPEPDPRLGSVGFTVE